MSKALRNIHMKSPRERLKIWAYANQYRYNTERITDSEVHRYLSNLFFMEVVHMKRYITIELTMEFDL